MMGATVLTERQRQMLLASEPDDLTGEEGAGVELYTGADYAVAKALKRRELGTYQEAGGLYCGLYFNNADGLALRAEILGIEPEGGE